jgi:hypothetical protein
MWSWSALSRTWVLWSYFGNRWEVQTILASAFFLKEQFPQNLRFPGEKDFVTYFVNILEIQKK